MSNSRLHRFVQSSYRIWRSFRNFIRSSALSLLVILIILLLLTQMDQALTMMVDLVENRAARFSLFLALYLINALALVLSHYPIYTYYAANLNNSGNYTRWHAAKPFKFLPFRKYTVFVFTTQKNSEYKPDRTVNYMRYALGILIHAVWIHFVLTSFEPNLYYDNYPTTILKWACWLLLLVPLVLYVRIKERFAKHKEQADHAESGVDSSLDRLYRQLGLSYFLVGTLTWFFTICLLVGANFSEGGLYLLLICSYLYVLNYLLFRLLRTRLHAIKDSLRTTRWKAICWFLDQISFLQRSRNYLGMFLIHALVALSIVLYSTIGGIAEWELANGIPLLLAFFYLYYYLIASFSKFFFVSRKMKTQNSKRFRLLFFGSLTLILLATAGWLIGPENRTHELDLVTQETAPIREAVFVDRLKQQTPRAQLYIASHGGGLKANVWTLNVVNHLQTITGGALLDQTVALSGASGGSLGLALYTGLYRSYAKDTVKIQEKIDVLSRRNYTSVDLAFTFGLDTYRKIWPLNQRIGLRDRPYYAMRKYQNEIETARSTRLSALPFRSYWKEAFVKEGYFPSLIMNTAGTQGNRGILWSVHQDDFDNIFPNAANLADLDNDKTLPFYQAVSTTNRFPVFSPAAKIPGYGHYIDAGAIDNSGLLGCLDLHNYLSRTYQIDKQKNSLFIEIINSKGLYIHKLIQEFQETQGIAHLAIDEIETDNLVADLQTGLNLDKIPNYLSDYLQNWSEADPNVAYVRLYMPHKVRIEEVESSLGGHLTDEGIRESFKAFLDRSNKTILSLTPVEGSTFNPWMYYEPTLSRHLSESSIRYLKAMLKHPELRSGFEQIESLTNPQQP